MVTRVTRVPRVVRDDSYVMTMMMSTIRTVTMMMLMLMMDDDDRGCVVVPSIEQYDQIYALL